MYTAVNITTPLIRFPATHVLVNQRFLFTIYPLVVPSHPTSLIRSAHYHKIYAVPLVLISSTGHGYHLTAWQQVYAAFTKAYVPYSNLAYVAYSERGGNGLSRGVQWGSVSAL